MINFALTILEQNQHYPEKLAIRDGYDDLTYGQLSIKIKQVAAYLRVQKINAGETVLIIMEDCVDWPCVFLGCLYAGIVPMPLSSVVGVDFMQEIADFIDCKLVFSSDLIAKKILDNLPTWKIPLTIRSDLGNIYYRPTPLIEAVRVHPDAVGFMSLSSGSTGTPKVIAHRHQVFYEVLKITPPAYEMTFDSVMMSTPKMSWGFGLVNSLTCTLGLGATAIVIPELPARKTIFEYADRYRPTIMISSPSVIRRLLMPSSTDYQLPSSVQHFHSSGEDLPGIMYDTFYKKYGIKITTSLGQSEMANIPYCYTTRENPGKGTVGRPSPLVEIKLVNESKTITVPNQVGEIYVKGSSASMYYYKNYNKTKETFVGEWTRTYDCAFYDTNGNIVFVGRTDDMFKVNDLIVSPVAIENEILNYLSVDQVVITGIVNRTGVKEVHAFVVPTDTFDLNDFKKYCHANLILHQVPRHVHLIDSIPETMTNKKNRKHLTNYVA